MKPEIHRWAPGLIWIAVLAIGCWYAVTSTHIHTELTLLLPTNGSQVQQLLSKHLKEGATSRLILIGLKGEHETILAEGSKTLATIMRNSGNFSYVRNGDASRSLRDDEILFQYRYLLSPAIHPEHFRIPEIRKALERRLQDLTAPLPSFIKNRILDDPTGEFLKILQTWIPSKSPQMLHGVWFSSDRQYALMVAETNSSGLDLDAQEQIQRDISAAVSRINQERVPQTNIQLVQTGPSVFAVESRAAIKQEAQRLSLLATTIVIGFLLARYRSLTLIGLSIVPLASGLLAGIIVVNSVYGFIHGITLAFGTTLIGVAIDFPVHLFSHLGPNSSPTSVLGRIWPIMRLGALTTAVGYGAMLFSGFPGLSQLGLFAIVGLLTAAMVTKGILPALIPRGFAVVPIKPGLVGAIDILPRASKILIVIVVIALGYLVVSPKPLWENDLANLTPIPQNSKQMDAWLRAELGAPDVRDVIVMTAPTEQKILERGERLLLILNDLVSQEAISGYDLAARYLPSVRVQRMRQDALPDTKVLQERLTKAREGLPFKPDLFQTFIQDVAVAKRLQPLDSQGLHGTMLRDKIQSLLFQEKKQWVGLVTLRGVKKRTSLIALSAEPTEGDWHYLDLKQESNRMVTGYRQEMMKFLSFGAVTIMLILGFVLRSALAVFRVLFPVTTATLSVVAILHLLDEQLSLFHLASMLLVVGIGLDYALFFNRKHQSEAERAQTILAVLVCAVTTILVFGLLALSQTPVLHSIGSTAAMGAFCCFLFSAMVRRPVLDSKSSP